MRDDPPLPPAFGEADLSNCERELIHLPGSIQPHGVVLVLSPDGRRILQASANTAALMGVPADRLLDGSLEGLGGDLPGRIRTRIRDGVGGEPLPLRGALAPEGVGPRGFEALLHRNEVGAILVELEPADLQAAAALARELPRRLAAAVGALGESATLDELAANVVAFYREVAGYDRVMVYRFDADGHGEVVAEGKEEHLEPYLGLHYPSSDIPHRARELYLRNRVRVLVDVHYHPVPLLPRLHPPTGEELDMSMSWLRSMSPLHLQYLKNMGVTATLVASLVREGELWGLVACHHYTPRRIPYAVRAACDLVAEVAGTRIAVLENFARVRSEVLLRRLEGQLIQSTAIHGDWRPALLDDPRAVLRLVGAGGAVLAFDGELYPMGEVPATPELRRIVEWVASRPEDGGVVASSSVTRDLPELEGAASTAAGVLAVPLSAGGESLIWFRGEQVHEVRWAGNPNKPVLVGDDPRDLSPRRSFAVWTEQVRGTARPWSPADLLTARAVGASLRDVVLQVRSMSLLLVERRLSALRDAIQKADEGVLITDGAGRILFANEAFSRLFRRPHRHLVDLDDLAPLFRKPWRVREMIRMVREERRNWRGELELDSGGDDPGVPIAVRADRVERPDGQGAMGHIVLVTNLTERQEATAARERLRRAILDAQEPLALAGLAPGGTPPFEELIRAVLVNASVAVAEVAEGGASADVIPVLDGLEAATKRATELTRRITAYAVSPEESAGQESAGPEPAGPESAGPESG
jgi:two-component system, chemotaxis family, sensor kinase Cph1